MDWVGKVPLDAYKPRFVEPVKQDNAEEKENAEGEENVEGDQKKVEE